jgi:hypothetical protein
MENKQAVPRIPWSIVERLTSVYNEKV